MACDAASGGGWLLPTRNTYMCMFQRPVRARRCVTFLPGHREGTVSEYEIDSNGLSKRLNRRRCFLTVSGMEEMCSGCYPSYLLPIPVTDGSATDLGASGCGVAIPMMHKTAQLMPSGMPAFMPFNVALPIAFSTALSMPFRPYQDCSRRPCCGSPVTISQHGPDTRAGGSKGVILASPHFGALCTVAGTTVLGTQKKLCWNMGEISVPI